MEEYKVGECVRIRALMSAFEARYGADFYFGGENHNFWELVYVIDGKAGVSADGRVYELNPGEIIFHKPMEFHKIWAVSNIRPHVLIMSFFADGSRMTDFAEGVYKLSYGQREKILETLGLCRRPEEGPYSADGVCNFLKLWGKDPLSCQRVGNSLEGFLLSILATGTKMAAQDCTKNAKIFQDIVRVLEDHIEEWISVEDVARLCASSVSNIKKVFGKYASHGIHKYFVKMKIIRAVTMLENGYAIQDISERLAFNNPNYFSMVFKRETGYSPMQYRKIFLTDAGQGGKAVQPVFLV